MSQRLITPKAFAQRLTVSTTQLGRMDKAGIGPKRVPLSARRFAYVETEVDAYIDSLLEHRAQVAS